MTTRYSASLVSKFYVSKIDPVAIDALRRQGLSYSEIGQQLGTTKDAARGVHRRWGGHGLDVPGDGDAADVSPAGAGGPAGDRGDAPGLPAGSDGRDLAGDHPRANRADGRGSAAVRVSVKSEIDLARAAIAKVTRAEIRLKHSLLADRETNEVLAQRLLDFDRAIQSGHIPSLALKLVTEDEW